MNLCESSAQGQLRAKLRFSIAPARFHWCGVPRPGATACPRACADQIPTRPDLRPPSACPALPGSVLPRVSPAAPHLVQAKLGSFGKRSQAGRPGWCPGCPGHIRDTRTGSPRRRSRPPVVSGFRWSPRTMPVLRDFRGFPVRDPPPSPREPAPTNSSRPLCKAMFRDPPAAWDCPGTCATAVSHRRLFLSRRIEPPQLSRVSRGSPGGSGVPSPLTYESGSNPNRSCSGNSISSLISKIILGYSGRCAATGANFQSNLSFGGRNLYVTDIFLGSTDNHI